MAAITVRYLDDEEGKEKRNWSEILPGSEPLEADQSQTDESASRLVVVAHSPSLSSCSEGKYPWEKRQSSLIQGQPFPENAYLIVISGGGFEEKSIVQNVYLRRTLVRTANNGETAIIDEQFKECFARFIEALRHSPDDPQFDLLEPIPTATDHAARAISILDQSIEAAEQQRLIAKTDWVEFVREACNAILKGVPKHGEAQAASGNSAQPDRGKAALVRELEFLGYSRLLPNDERSALPLESSCAMDTTSRCCGASRSVDQSTP